MPRRPTGCPRRRRGKKPKLEETPVQGDPAPPVYMLLGHGSVRPAYSVFKVDPYANGGRKARLLARLECKHSKSFVSVRSKHCAWIVGVGGSSTKSSYGAETIIFDADTHKVITGPDPGSTKRNPVLLTVGQRVYALARCPSVNGRPDNAYDGRINFCPWFEVLDLSQAEVVDGSLTGCEWKALPTPPFFPWGLNPYQYIRPTMRDFTVKSYAAVGSYILVSVAGHPGIHAFDTDKELWTTLDATNTLPFSQGAIPHGSDLFLGVSRATGAITAYKISVVAGVALAIMEIPVLSALPGDEEVMTTNKFLSLGIDRGFCSVNSWSVDESWDPPYLRANIKVIAYGTEDFEGTCLDVSKRWKQLFKIHDPVRTLDSPCVAAVFSL
ncbi:uncharacterized protein LOC124665684 [Lolium rigidum]|uniref:uncharacterized protein LOC124665684 n=1 Tax=Lolium rigidum TaxID=89674 RepID=UPI001F5DD3F5|nr:uncharacterized protein LOC124665684 [Lolium rigidum]